MQPSARFTVVAGVVLAACHDPIAGPTSHPNRANAGYGSGGSGGTGGTIVFQSRLEGNDDVWIMNADGTSLTNLTRNPAHDVSPDWSGNGKQIVFLSDRDDDVFDWELYVMNADGTGITRLTYTGAPELQPKFSPNSKQILFTRFGGTDLEVFVMNADGTSVTNLTNNPADDRDATWSPDGKEIAFTSTRDGFEEIYVMNADGSSARRLTYLDGTLGPIGYLAWSPDGKQIAFATDNVMSLYMINVDGTGLKEVIDFHKFIEGLDWSPNGKQLVVALGVTDKYDIDKVNADGTGITQITFNETNSQPAWTR